MHGPLDLKVNIITKPENFHRRARTANTGYLEWAKTADRTQY